MRLDSMIIKYWILTICLLTGQFSYASEPAQPILHYTLYYPPYWETLDDDIEGYHARLARTIYDRAGLNIKMVTVPYARINDSRLPEDVGIIAYGANKETDHQFLFPVPQTTIYLKIYGLTPDLPTNIQEFKGKNLIIKRGFPLVDFSDIQYDSSFNTIQVNSVLQAINMLLVDRGDYLITLDDPFQFDIKRAKKSASNIHSKVLRSLDGWPIVVVKSHPQAEMLYRKIKQAYEELRSEGVITYQDSRLLLTTDF